MFSLPIGFALTCLILFFSINHGDWALYLNKHSILMVIGGTASILLFATPVRVLASLAKAMRELGSASKDVNAHWNEMKSLAETRALGQRSSNALINHAVGLWEAGVSSELFIVMLSQKRSELENAGADAVQAMRNLAKYPPALGMTGTVVGLVSLFSQLSGDNRNALGPALALAMTATFFGLVLANGIITPLADRLHVQHMWKKRMYTDVYQMLLLINRGESLDLVKNEGERAAG